MKKFLAILLLLTMCLGMLVACGGDGADSETTAGDGATAEATLQEAVEFLAGTYKSDEGKATPADYKLVSQILIGETKFEVTWTVDNEAIKLTLVDGMYNVDVPGKNETEFTYTLTATVKDAAGQTATKTFTRKLPVYDNSAAVGENDIKENTPYKFYMTQAGVGKTLFLVGTTQQNNKFIETTIDPKAALDFYAEKAEGGYKFYTEINGAKNYIYATTVTGDDGKVSKYLGYSAENSSVFYYKSELGTWFTKVDNIEYGIGTYGTYETACLSESTHFKAEDMGTKQFPLTLVDKAVAEAMTPTEGPELPTDKTSIKDFNAIAEQQEDKGNPTVEKYLVEGEITEIKSTEYGNMYIKDAEGNQLYIYGVYSNDGKTRFDAMNPQPKVGDTITIVGVACNYNGPQMKNGWVQTLNGEAYVSTGSGSTDTPSEPAGTPVTPEVGKTYKLSFVQKNKNNTTYYLTGVLDGFYAATSEKASEGADFAIEATDGGYYLVCTVGGAKKYVNVIEADGTDGKKHINVKFDDAAASVWTIDATLNTVATVLNEKSYILGTKADGTYTTLGPMAADSGCMYAQFVVATASENPGTGDDKPADTPVDTAGTKVIYFTADKKYVTSEVYVYTSSSGSTKDELVLSDDKAAAVSFTIVENSNGSVSFKAGDKYLYADGTNVKFVTEAGENTEFVLESTDGGVFIKCMNATFNGKAQYLEVYKGYLTCYGMGSDASIYTFEIQNA